MSFLVLISLLAITLHGAHVPTNLFKDPASFISSLVDANPATVKKMEDMVNELVEAGQNEKSAVIATHNDAVAAYDSAVADHADAKSAHAVAAGEAATATGVFNDKTSREETAAAIEKDRATTLHNAQLDFDYKDSVMKSENIRLDSEKALLEQIASKLDTLLPGVSFVEGKLAVIDFIVQRHLLIDDFAAPDAVQKIVDKINAMIGVGEGERRKVNEAQADAQSHLEKSTTAHEEAVAAHTKAAGELGQATNELNRLTGILEVKTAELKDALTVMNEKQTDMDEKKGVMDAEVLRLDEEDAILKEVLVALANINTH